ncbi:putative phosphatidylinositol-4-phosphate 5-kinase [Podospora australis]|uniref:1-phosphatidylinositol-3-phosphate 5-kinase n=1 Tax=Podospora australis TaxID=1536484 RepID=A0AAN7AP85_9PEZI|nr:putative phosphatidylinositol-4-phosphate 5-kinase [Podospora australis]
MANPNGLRPPTLTFSSPSSPATRPRSRRESLVSPSSAASQAERDHLSLTLDKIHTSASQSDTLTTFNDFTPAPASLPTSESKGSAGEIVQQGLSGLYSRIKEAVSGVGKNSTHDVDDGDTYDGSSKRISGAASIASRASLSPATRGDSGVTSSTFESTLPSDGPTSGLSSSVLATTATTESMSSVPQSSKASSITTASASKSQSPSVQTLSRMGKTATPTMVGATVAPVTAPAFKDLEPGRGTTTREELPGRASGRRSMSRPSDVTPGPLMLSANGSIDSVAISDRTGVPSRTRRDDALSLDGSTDTPRSPVQSSAETRPPSGNRLEPSEILRRPAVIDRITYTRGAHSRSSSMEPGTAEASPVVTSAHSSVYHDNFAHHERPQRLQSGLMKIPGTTTNEGAPEMVNARLERMRKQVMSKEFWMADETCKECFLCGTPFSAFRRKHHCRTCGCIFDSKCTSSISGAKFGVQGSLRVCKTCLNVINRRYDSGSDDSADESYLPAIFRANQAKHAPHHAKLPIDDEASMSERTEQANDTRTASTPMMAIPATRRVGDSNRHSAILEIDMPGLARPSSSRSLKSLANNRPQSSSHRRHHSKHNFLTRFKGSSDERAPFRKPASDDPGKKSNVNAFHADNIIDPELAPYMSDQSSEDEQMSSIFATMNSNEFQPGSLDPDRGSFGTYLTAGRKHRFRPGEKSTSGLSYTSRGIEDSGGLQNLSIHARPPRRRNMSIASISVHHLRSPRPKSAIIKGASTSADTLSLFEGGIDTALKRTDSSRDGKPTEGGLNPASLQHVKKLFRQMLDDAEIPNQASWEKAVIPILEKCADDVDPDIRNGDDMDIRHWVKLKKIPGGRPSDTAYVHGVVFTKNLALKSMPRKIRNPKIVIITFPLEYQRHPEQHFMSLQPVIEQEKEYLRMVVNRILNLEPHVLLVEKSVAGVALQYLSEANIAVAYNVKPAVIEAVSRIVNMPVISSMDMLSLGARVGTCESFEVRTFVNHGVKGGKKTYIFLSGCPKDRGCTIALRGATTQVLAQMKRITEFMVYVVYNLKLESCLMRDEFVQIPAEIEPAAAPSTLSSRQVTDDSLLAPAQCAPDPKRPSPAILVTSQSTEDEAVLKASDGATADPEQPAAPEVVAASQPSPQPPSDATQRLISLHESHSHVQVPEDVPMPTFYSDMVAKYETRILSSSPFVKFTQPYLLMKAREQERRLVYLRRLRDQDIVEDAESEKVKSQKFQLIKPEMVHEIGQKAPRQIMEVLHAVHDAEYDKALHNYQTQARQWESYIENSLDLFDPYSHQNIVVLYSVTCTATKIPCVEPDLIAIEFYNEHPDANGNMDQDCTLGQYIEDICENADLVCHFNGCDRKQYEHHRTYVHDNARITIILEKSPVWPENFPEKPQEKDGDKEGTGMCMWNYCKECKKHFGLMPMSVSSWKYSFGKYLELSFWSRCVRSNSQTECPHDHQKDHIRFFYYLYSDIAVRIHYDPIDLYEVIVPRPRLTWKVDNDLRLKNDICIKAEERWNRFMNSVKTRLKSIRIDSVLPEKAETCTSEIERLTKKAHEDQAELIRSLQKAYMSSKYYEVIPLNAVIRGMLEKVTDWDAAFAKFEADFLSDKDVRQLTIIQLKKMFTDNESKESLPSTDGTISIGSESEEKGTPAVSQQSMSEFEEKPSQTSEGDTSQPQDIPLSPATHPVTGLTEGGAEEANELLDHVEHLDLATPTSPALAKSVLAGPDLGLEAILPPADELPTPVSEPVPEPVPELDPTPLPPAPVQSGTVQSAASEHMSLTEKVEQLRREQRAPSNDANVTGEGAAAPSERPLSRRTGLTVSPPIARALSQPVLTVPRTQSAIGKLLKEQKANEASAEAQKAPGEGPSKGEKKFPERLSLGALKNRKPAPSGIPRYVHKRESKVSTLARHFEQLSREFEKERMRDRKQRAAKMQSTRAFLPRSTTKTIVEVYKDVDQAVQELGPDEDPSPDKDASVKKSGETTQATPGTTPEESQTKSSSDDERGPTSPLEPSPPSQPEGTVPGADADENQRQNRAESDDEGAGSDAETSTITLDEFLPDAKDIAASLEPSEEIPEELPRHQKKSLMTMLTNFWAERSASNWTPLEYPISSTDHIFFDSDVIVREDEPSSLLAFALSSEDYKNKLDEIRQKWGMSNHHRDMSTTDDSSDGLEMKRPQQPPGLGKAELEDSLLRSMGTHLKYQFTEGSAKMMCKIFFAEQFDALRRKCGAADRFAESLSRCLKWDSKGGKTKSVFLKTLDDRFVLKSLSPIETTSFLRFAPDYFELMAHALFHDLPSVIAKMLGFFQIIIKNPLTNTEIKLDLLVMENLFYDRSPSRTFDLKGSMRNRRIQSTGEQNEVLLDENMVEYIYESPLFAREHSKRLLRASVFNDTLFLARQGVMDYSLMVAVDEVKKELVVGIIDCIRTYTWDKQLESWIKNRGFAGGGRNRPTVTSPKEYKSRFREAMARYILQAPNCWHTFGNTLPPNTPATPRTRFEGDAGKE